jgi:hypothetical protein
VAYGAVVEITASGTYVLQGTLNTGFVAVSKKELEVTLVLNGVNIFCKNYAAITCLKKSNITVELAEGSTNYLTDGGEGADADGKYAYAYDSEEAPNAALLIRTDLTVKGSGKLIVNGGANNGIGSRANLKIESGDITAYAVNNVIKGNDSVTISGGKFLLYSKGDGVASEAALTISNASIKIKTGGGSSIAATENSAKALKAVTELDILSGTFEIDSNDDAVHSNGNVTIEDGTITAATADDGIHADGTVNIKGGAINLSKCYEGIEGLNVNISGGVIKIKSTDDGINIADGADSSATANRPGGFGGGRPGQGGGGEAAIDGALTISGGNIHVEAYGDGLDSNGNIVISGGTVTVVCKSTGPDMAIDYNGTYTETGGTVTVSGKTRM